MITLKDAANADVTYQQLSAEGFRTTYIGANHSDMSKDQVILNSVSPKRSGVTFGNRRASINLVTSVTVPTPGGETEVKDMKFELVTSVPVGVSASAVDEAMARISAAVANATLVEGVAVIGKTQF